MTALSFAATSGLSEKEMTEFIKLNDADNECSMTTWLYADPAFDTWLTAINASTYTKTEDEKTFSDAYSSYTLAIKCDITKIRGQGTGTNRGGMGCCLRDES